MKPRHVVAHSVWSGGQARGVHGNPTGGRQVFGWVAPASDEPKTVGQERLVVGLQVTIGAQLLPLMTQLVIWATTRLVPMLKRTGDWLKNHHRQIADLAPKILKVALALAGVFSAPERRIGAEPEDGRADDHREEDRQHDVHDRPGDLAVHRHHRYVRCLEDDQRRQHDPEQRSFPPPAHTSHDLPPPATSSAITLDKRNFRRQMSICLSVGG